MTHVNKEGEYIIRVVGDEFVVEPVGQCNHHDYQKQNAKQTDDKSKCSNTEMLFFVWLFVCRSITVR